MKTAQFVNNKLKNNIETFTEFIMNYFIRLSLILFIFCQTASSLAMMPHESLNQEIKQRIHENPFIEKKIIKMIINQNPNWASWLIKRNCKHPLKHVRLNHIDMIHLDTDRIMILYFNWKSGYGEWVTVDKRGSFQSYRDTHPYKCKVRGDGSIKIKPCKNNEGAVIVAASQFHNTAFSPDKARFFAITDHEVFIWDGKNGELIDKITFSDCTLTDIVDVKMTNYAIVLQTGDKTTGDKTIFLYDPVEKTKHIIYQGFSDKEYGSNVISITFKDHYKIIETTQEGWSGFYGKCNGLIISTLTDIYDLFFQLNFDQMELLAYIYYCAKHHHRVDLTGNSPQQLIAQIAFKHLPDRIKQLVHHFVIMPGRLENCTIC